MRKSGVLVSMVVLLSLIFAVSCVSKEVPVTETYYEIEYRTEEYTDIEKVARVVEGEDQLTPEVYWSNTQIYYVTDPTEKRYASKSYLCYLGYELTEHRTAQASVYTWTKSGYIKAYDVSDVNHIDSPGDVPAGVPGGNVLVQYLPDWPWWKRPEGWKPSPELSWPPYALNSYVAFLNSILNADRCIYQGGYSRGSTCEFDVSGVTKLALLVDVSGFQPGFVTNPIRSIKLAWHDETIEEKTVTKEHQVPHQVEKQRTVMQTKKVPFWEVIFSK